MFDHMDETTEVSISTTTVIHDDEQVAEHEIEGKLKLLEELLESVRERVETGCLETAISMLRGILDNGTHAAESRVVIYHQLMRALLVRYGVYGWIEDLDACLEHLEEDVGAKRALEFLLLHNINGSENSILVQVPAQLLRICQLIRTCRNSIDTGSLSTVARMATETLDSYKSSYSGDKLAIGISKLRILLGKALVMKYLSDGEISRLDQATQYLQDSELWLSRIGKTSLAYVSLASLQHIGCLRLIECRDLEAFISLRSYREKKAAADEEWENLYKTGTGMTEQAGDLQEGIALLTASLNCCAGAHSRRSFGLNALAKAFITSFESTGNYEKLEAAVVLTREALDLRQPPHPLRSTSLINMASSLSNRFKHKGVFGDLEDCITLQQEALDLCPPPHPHCAVLLNNLADSLSTRFKHKGAFEDLEQSIKLNRHALDLRQPPHPDHSMSLNNLAGSLSTRFDHKGTFEDLEESIKLYREALARALELYPPPHLLYVASLGNLASSLSTRFEYKREFGDLEESIALHREALDLRQLPHPDRPMSLSDLADSLFIRFEHKGAFEDLDECITLQQGALDLRRPPHPDRSLSLNSLGNSLSTRFEHKGAFEDIEESIALHREALDLRQPPHPNRSASLSNLAASLIIRFERKRMVSDIENALQYLQEASKYPTGLLLNRFKSSINWVACAQKHYPASTLDASICLIELLPQLASLDLTVQQRQDALHHCQDYAGELAKYAIDAGQIELAITFLSTGRSVFWSQALQLRTPVDQLMETHSDIAEKFMTVSRHLENASHSQQVSASSSFAVGEAGVGTSTQSSLYKLASQRQEIIEEIRRIPGYEGFLLPHSFLSLKPAAKKGPIIFLNASILRCDAIAMHGAEHPKVIPLPDIHWNQLEALKMLINNLSQSGRRSTEISQDMLDTFRKWLGRDMVLEESADSSEGIFRSTLESLWNKVVWPVLNALQIEKTDSLTRIWWCPTGPFSSLPIHAAGVYSTENEPIDCLFQYAVSSYITSPQDLLHSPPQSTLPFKVTAVIEPEAVNAGPLPFTREELKRIGVHVPRQYLIEHIGSNSTPNNIGDIVSSIQQSSFVHFGCHGMQSLKDPLESCLLLSGGRLTMSKLMKECRVPEGALAYLSACETAKGDESRPDESLNLVATMMFAGFRSVVGTMWSILDCDAPIVADVFYRHLFRNGKETPPDVTDAAYGLHLATKRLRDEGRPFLSWVPYVHYGI